MAAVVAAAALCVSPASAINTGYVGVVGGYDTYCDQVTSPNTCAAHQTKWVDVFYNGQPCRKIYRRNGTYYDAQFTFAASSGWAPGSVIDCRQ
jgi:hypothetical protein